jgi:hypothetical protein
MNPMRINILIVAILIAFSPVAHAETWDGTYTYEDGVDDSVEPSYMGAKYTVELGANGICSIRISGAQIDEDILCDTLTTNNKIVILFKSYASGSVQNKDGVSLYRSGEPLLSFEHAPKKGEQFVKTIWYKLKGLSAKSRKSGIYFKTGE